MNALASNLQPQVLTLPGDEAGEWVHAAMLGVGDRQVRRIAEKLDGLKAVRKNNGEFFFRRNHPDIAARVRQAHRDRSYEAESLAGLTAKQIDQARAKLKVLDAAGIEIPKRVETARCGRVDAAKWFCSVFLPASDLGFPNGVPVQTFYRWEKRARTAPEFRLRSLVDVRGRTTSLKPQASGRSAEAWDYFKHLYLDPRKPGIQTCYELTAQKAAEQQWSWPAYNTICRAVRDEIPKATQVLFREGRKAFESTCVPRVRRSFDHLATHDTWCADESTLDFYCRCPDGKGGWKRIRPILTAWLDIRSRYFVGWHISDRANSDTIVCAFKRGVQAFGPPREVLCDNGADYKAVAGRSRKWASFDEGHLTNLYKELGVECRWAIPYEPWAKMIESHFRTVHEHHDKLWDTYCGGKPEDRPEGVVGLALTALPTIDEVRTRFAEWLEAHHARPQSGDGMCNLAPAQALEQFRGASVRQKPDEAMLDFLCAKVTKPVSVTRDGVRHNGIHYGQGQDALLRRLGEKVLLRVPPERADYVDVCELDGRPICRATEDRLRGVDPADIRTAMSRRKHARAIAREAAVESPYAGKYGDVQAAVKAMQNRRKAEIVDLPPPPAPKIVQATRPDLAADVARLHSEAPSKPVREEPERPSLFSAEDIAAALQFPLQDVAVPTAARGERLFSDDDIASALHMPDYPVAAADVPVADDEVESFDALGWADHEPERRRA
jgi:transposase InsO family protein